MTPHLDRGARRTRIGLPAVTLTALALAACGSESSGSGSASASSTPVTTATTAPAPTTTAITTVPTTATATTTTAVDVTKVTLKVGIQNSGSSVAKAILDKSKALEGTPYKLEWSEFPGADGAVEALNAGAIDFSVGLNPAAPVLAQGNAKNAWTTDSAPFKIIAASKNIGAPGIAIAVKNGSGIESVADLKGKKVSFAKGTANHYYFVLAAKDAGLDPKSVELALMPLSEARAAFVGGAVDALVTAVGNARPLVNKNNAKILVTSKGRFDTYSFVVARPSAIVKPEAQAAVRDFLLRLQKANDWEKANEAEVTQLYISVAKQPAEDAKLSAQESNSVYVPLDAAVVAAQQDQADVFAEAGVAGSKVDVKIAFDTRFSDLFKKSQS